MSEQTGARAALEALEEEGVSVVFGHPGGAALPLYDELTRSRLRHVLVRHEQNAAHMADGYARITHRTGVCFATSGPGATNLVTGVATAYLDSSPVLAVTGQVATSSLGTDAFQEVDAFGLFMPIVKHNWRLERAQDTGRVFHEAYRLAMTGRYGPVHVDFPLDVQRGVARQEPVEARPFPRPAAEDLRRLPEALRILEEAQAPVILVGGGARWSNAAETIVELATAVTAPMVTTLIGKGCVPEAHPLALGPVGMHGKLVATYVLNNADVVVALGTRFSDRSTGRLDAFGKGQRIIHVDIDPAEVGKNVPGCVGLVGDVERVARRLLEGLLARGPRKDTPWSRRVAQLKRDCACDFDVDGRPLKPQRVVRLLNEHLPHDAIVTTEVGRHQMWLEHFLLAGGGRTFLTSGGLGTMGFGFPAAIGAKFAAPDRFAIDVAGDGSIQMTIKELATARENDVPVVVLIMNDQALGMVLQWQREFYGGRLSAVEFRRNPDFVKLAESFDCHARRADRPSDVADALLAARTADRPTVIDVPIDVTEEVLPLVPPGKTYREAILGSRCIWKHKEEPHALRAPAPA